MVCTPRREQDFYTSDEGKNHPKPSKEYMDLRKQMDDAYIKDQSSLIPGM